jgi:hypothetical protein
VIVFLAFLAAAAVLAPDSPLYDDGRPPLRFQGDATVRLEITDQAGIERSCHALFGAPPAGMRTNACQTGERMIVPNPCRAPQTETYARLLCHELGHANGWASTHGEGGLATRAPARPAAAPGPQTLTGGATSDHRDK